MVSVADFGRWPEFAALHNRNACIFGDFVEEDVAADPACAPCCWRERWAFLDGRESEGEMRHEDDAADCPVGEVVVEDVEIGSAVFDDSAFHFGVGGVDDFRADRSGLAFQLEGRITGRAEVVDCGEALWRGAKAWRLAGGAEEIRSAPGFGADAGALRGVFVAVEPFGREMQVHARIRSWRLSCKEEMAAEFFARSRE